MGSRAVAKVPEPASNDLVVPRIGSGTLERGIAEMAVEGIAPNALVALAFSKPSGFGKNGLGDSVLALQGHIDRVKRGDLSGPEGLLVSQAYTLNTVFTELARKAAENLGHYPDAVDRYLRLAMKAQSQSRCAIEALVEMKNPRQPVFAKQANITSGPQQVNNGVPRGEQGAIPPNEL